MEKMYYLRSMSIQRSDVVSNMQQSANVKVDNDNDYEECLSCQ